MHKDESQEILSAESTEWHGERTRVEVHSRVADSALESRALGPLQLVHMRCGSVTIGHGARDIRGGERASTFILQVSGRAAFHHYGNRIALEQGDFTLCDNASPYTMHFDGPSEVIMVRLDTRLVKALFPTPDCFCGRRLEGATGLTSTAAAMAIDLSRKSDASLDVASRDRAARHLLDVLTTSYAGAFDQMLSTSSLMAGRFWKVKLFIEENLRDPGLSPSVVARRLKLSDRYLRTIFAVSDESPSAFILRRRLEECARQLRDPHWRGHSITDIAFGWGFNSAPHFARTFRERFHAAPRDYRQQALESQAPAALILPETEFA